MTDDEEKKEEPKVPEKSEETEIILPEKDWQLALGGTNKASDQTDDD